MECYSPSELLIFICPRREAGYAGHLLSLFREPLMSVVSSLLGAWAFSFRVFFDHPVLTMVLSKNRPRADWILCMPPE